MNKRLLNFLGGDPQRIDDDEFFQNAVIEAIKGLASVWQSGTLDPIIVSGLVGTVGATHTVYTSGYIIVNSEIYFVNGGSFLNGSALGINIDSTFDTNGDKVFENLSNHSTYEIRQGILKSYSGTDMDIADFRSIKDRLQSMGAVLNRSTGWDDLPTLSANYTVPSLVETLTNTTKFRLNNNGDVEFKGFLECTDMQNSAGLICTLPLSLRPTSYKAFTCYGKIYGDSQSSYINVSIRPDGKVWRNTVRTGGETCYFSLDSIRFTPL